VGSILNLFEIYRIVVVNKQEEERHDAQLCLHF